MGLLVPILREERYLEGREVRKRTTHDIGGYKISELGLAVRGFIVGEGSCI